jgi:hypothetical protein
VSEEQTVYVLYYEDRLLRIYRTRTKAEQYIAYCVQMGDNQRLFRLLAWVLD